ncbi:MAG: oligopeptide transporter, OPT family [Candidatus Eremiobacteraeota bacterium]|nr:oligopeptide transporter, OPT family [Candidatus Eremiobacteraeota bacterium]
MSLPPEAYRPLEEGEQYQPVVPSEVSLPEFTFRAIITGAIVGIIFGFANAYLGLKVGLTVSASIPAAVIGVLVFRLLRFESNVLETNIIQTVGSAGESLAAGVIFTLPVLFLWGEPAGFWPIFPLSLLGGLLGVFFMIPLRRTLIVSEHGKLTYPEGTACAEVQVAAQAGGEQGKMLSYGALSGALFTLLQKFHLFPDEPDFPINLPSYRTAVGGTLTAELLGVGYIIGPEVAAVMLAGGVVGWLVIIPLIYYFGGGAVVPLAPEAEHLIRDMSHWDLWQRYLRYIGAGAVAFGGLFTLIKSTPTLIESFRMALVALKEKADAARPRTERELSLTTVGAALALIALLAAFLPLRTGHPGGMLGPLAGLAVIIFSFFFVTVSSRIVGLLGASSNPISGMTIATVLLCALIFGKLYDAEQAKVAVLTIGSLVCIAAAIAGDTSQDLKTGFLVGATPRSQQLAELIGVILSAITMAAVLALFKDQVMSGEYKAPQANLIKLVIDGVLDGNLPWGLILTGIFIAFCVEIMGLPTLAFAVGLYLPVHLAVPVMIGGLVRLLVEKTSPKEEVNDRRETGVLFSSGLIAGAALVGVGVAAATYYNLSLFDGETGPGKEMLALAAFGLLTGGLVWASRLKKISH